MFSSVIGAPRGVTLFTSLPPTLKRTAAGREVGAAYQRECIVSWRRLGFDVVSLNSRAEMEALLPFGYDVMYRKVGSCRPRICDIITHIKEEPAAIAGIINADCMMVANEQANSLVLQSARLGLVLIERLNIGADDVKVTGVSGYGFDLLLFAKQVLDDLELDPEISIGTPWWDYWFPIAYHLAGGQLFAAPAPLLMHLDHPRGWSQESWYTHGRKMHDALAKNKNSACSLPFIEHGRTNALSEPEVQDLATAAFQWLKTVPRVMQADDPSAWLWCSFLAGIETVPREAKEAERRLKDSLEAERRLKDSLSWKLTRPLRSIEDALSQSRLPVLGLSFLKRPARAGASMAPPTRKVPMVSYAQNFEDVMIARLFNADYHGFYIDIGAAHPDSLSVTRHFYNQGWSGINVEPSFRFYPLLCEARPNDINLRCAIGNNPGRAMFYEIPKVAENSTLERPVADRLAATELAATLSRQYISVGVALMMN